MCLLYFTFSEEAVSIFEHDFVCVCVSFRDSFFLTFISERINSVLGYLGVLGQSVH